MKRILLCALSVMMAGVMLASCSKTEGIEPSTATPAPAATPAPTPTPEPYEPNALTGEARDADYPAGQRITAIMVNNIVAARPQRGLSAAQILFEIKVEGGITRFMPLYNDYNDITEVGPIRSGRDQFFQLILPWQALYVHEGQSIVMEQYAKDYEYGTLNNNNGGNGYRDYNRVNWQGLTRSTGLAEEHTMYTNAENIQKYLTSEDVDMARDYNSTFFNFVDYRLENAERDLANSQDSAYVLDDYGPVVTDGEYVEITHSASYKTRMLYDAATKSYTMQQYYYTDKSWRDTVDENNDETLTFPNVIVLFTDIHTYPGHEGSDLQNVDYGPGGIGYYSYGGKTERIYWQKGSPLEALRLYYLTADGQCSDIPLEINLGKSYVAVVDVDEAGKYESGLLADHGLAAGGSDTDAAA